jgi:4-alpha-glucanotransferase
LWGMPVFRWQVLRKESYSWWVTRLKKNRSLFDLLRLDHFRAFADYWAIPAKDDTAKNGSWKLGPGQHFFDLIKQKLGGLPFVAEDLGDINQAVRRLRHDNGFPGMKVLHFAFSDNMSTSEYIPHHYTENFLVYTGTHDNNTTLGWFRRDITEIERGNLKRYFGIKNLASLQIPTLLIRLAYGSVAQLAMIPMQDLLGLDEKARINSPATIKNNWQWRMLPGTLTQELEGWLNEQMKIFNR